MPDCVTSLTHDCVTSLTHAIGRMGWACAGVTAQRLHDVQSDGAVNVPISPGSAGSPAWSQGCAHHAMQQVHYNNYVQHTEPMVSVLL